jgi:hypothetical protein
VKLFKLLHETPEFVRFFKFGQAKDRGSLGVFHPEPLAVSLCEGNRKTDGLLPSLSRVDEENASGSDADLIPVSQLVLLDTTPIDIGAVQALLVHQEVPFSLEDKASMTLGNSLVREDQIEIRLSPNLKPSSELKIVSPPGSVEKNEFCHLLGR